MKKYCWKWKKKVYFLRVIAVIFFAIFLRIFVFEIYTVQSESMANTLRSKDRVIINKMQLGPRLPQSPFEIPWVNTVFLLNSKTRSKIDSAWWQYKRISGLNSAERNDIIVFNQPVENTVLIKRCVALPGDTIAINKSEVFINGLKLPTRKTIKQLFHLYMGDPKKTSDLLDSYSINYYSRIDSIGGRHCLAFLDGFHLEILLNISAVDSIKKHVPKKENDYKSFIRSEEFNWSLNFFGPLVVPFKGMKIPLNYENYVKYSLTLREGEGCDIYYKNNQVYLDGQPVQQYKFRYDYYFMMGDNRYCSTDSRQIGLIPEYLLIGKVNRILFSNSSRNFLWKRLL